MCLVSSISQTTFFQKTIGIKITIAYTGVHGVVVLLKLNIIFHIKYFLLETVQ